MSVVAIVGRPNVGKSTLFNRLVGQKLALVDDRPGVTRDRREGEAQLGNLSFTVIDTAGLEEAEAGSLSERMRWQTEAAIDEADVVLFLMDARAGVIPDDQVFADLVRRSGKAAVVLANKAEGRGGMAGAYDAFSLGLGDPVPISAEHGEGLRDLFDALLPLIGDDDGDSGGRDKPLKVAIVGRPNAGKSTLVNRMLGQDRLLVGPEAGITRDTISVEWRWRDQPIRLFDTAGLRKRARVEDKLEKLSVADALRAVRFAEVVVVLLDATIPFEKQDLTIVDLIESEGRALVIGVNKWDLVADRPGLLKELREEATRLLPQVRGVPVVPVSGLAGEGVDRLMQAVVGAADTWSRRVPTARLNEWLAEALEAHAPPAVSGRRIKIRYMTQVKARPPHFALFGNQLDALPRSYTRYLVNGLREVFDLPGVPIRLSFRTGKNPFEGRKRD
ncbi:ribosome biogenesis GTPase Der [Enterovirga sp.]|uniref:ribosome biogenesis GTPase Der n=1 Tax=Enterovirga sp. TaxID=2026350 RepID=UPI00260C4720|nr:ribosome biogenesis GTPase Der [Enterovirga sp.]MDB5592239.1 small GTP-binding protein [Enterovirga sp.]